jgi:putative ABC transport system ATP-binding protein
MAGTFYPVREQKPDSPGVELERFKYAQKNRDRNGGGMELVIAKDLTKTYGSGDAAVSALRGISFSIEKGAFVSFIGPSGSGKTTLLNLMGCLDKPSGGRLAVAGIDISGFGPRDGARFRGKHIGFIFQSFNLLPVLTVFENVEYPLVMVQDVPASTRKERILGLLDSVGMMDQKKRFPDQLSGGQKQRVAIARALVTHPELVLADEPTANLDRDTAQTIIRLMKKMRQDLQTTFIFSTHDTRITDEAERIFRIEDGRLKSNGNSGGGGHG